MPTAPALDLAAVSFFGRTFAEYLQFFALDAAALAGRAILDVAAGPSSFAAQAVGRGLDVVAVDPRYGQPSDVLAGIVAADAARMGAEVRRKSHLLRFRSFASIDEAEASRRRAAEAFLADYPAGFATCRYVPGALPALPFLDRQFDLVLCAHLLFTYAHLLDFEFHLAACRELVRVGRGEVRLHPVVGLDGRPYTELGRLRRVLEAGGIRSRLRTTDYEFFAGTRQTLVLEGPS
jgi:hypothetical protein